MFLWILCHINICPKVIILLIIHYFFVCVILKLFYESVLPRLNLPCSSIQRLSLSIYFQTFLVSSTNVIWLFTHWSIPLPPFFGLPTAFVSTLFASFFLKYYTSVSSIYRNVLSAFFFFILPLKTYKVAT